MKFQIALYNDVLYNDVLYNENSLLRTKTVGTDLNPIVFNVYNAL